jgi:hypothetical protein
MAANPKDDASAKADRPVIAPVVATDGGESPADAAAAKDVGATGHAGWKGRAGFDALDPDAGPSLAGDDLLASARVKAPNLTREFVDAYGLDDDVLAGIARGEVPPPPHVGPIHTSDLYLTPGGWVNAPAGVPLEQAGSHAIAR